MCIPHLSNTPPRDDLLELYGDNSDDSQHLARRVVRHRQLSHGSCRLCLNFVGRATPLVVPAWSRICNDTPTSCPYLHFHINETCYVLRVTTRRLRALRRYSRSLYAPQSHFGSFEVPQFATFAAEAFAPVALDSQVPDMSSFQLQSDTTLFGQPIERPQRPRPVYTVDDESFFGVRRSAASRALDSEESSIQGVLSQVLQTVVGDEDLVNKSLASRMLTLSPQEDWMVKFAEDIVLFAMDMLRSRSGTERMCALARYMKMRGSTFRFQVVAGLAMHLMGNIFVGTPQEQPEVQGAEDVQRRFDDLRQHLKSYTAFKKSALFQKLYKFMCYLVSFGVIAKCGITTDWASILKVNDAILEKDYSSAPDLVHCVLDTITFVCSIGIQCFQTKSLQPIMHSGDGYQKWYEEVERLKLLSKHLSTLEAHGTTYFQYLSDLKSAIEQGVTIRKFAALESVEIKIVAAHVNALCVIDKEILTRKAALEDRAAPLGVVVSGPTSIGKSQFKQLLYHHYGAVRKLSTAPEFCYTRSPGAEFWDNFRSSMWCCIIDDAAQMNPALGLDQSVAELIQLCNNVAYIPNQADLADKGRTPFKCELVVATTNTTHLNAQHYYSHPIAVARRFLTVELALKPDFANTAGMLDPTKMLPDDTGYMNIWHIRILSVANDGNNRAKYTLEREFSDIYEFLRWYTLHILAHRNHQGAALRESSRFASLPRCELCFLPNTGCTCVPHSGTFGSNETPHRTVARAVSYIACTVGAMRARSQHALQVQSWPDVSDSISHLSERLRHKRDDFLQWGEIMCASCELQRDHFCFWNQTEVSFTVEDSLQTRHPAFDSEKDLACVARVSRWLQLRIWFFQAMRRWGEWWIVAMFFSWWFRSTNWQLVLARRLFWDVEAGGLFIKLIGHRVASRFAYRSFAAKLIAVAVSAKILTTAYAIIREVTCSGEPSAPTGPTILVSANATVTVPKEQGEWRRPTPIVESWDEGYGEQSPYYPQGNYNSTARVPEPRPNQPTKPFYRHDPVVLSGIELSQVSKCAKGQGVHNVFERNVSRNCAFALMSTQIPGTVNRSGTRTKMFHLSSQVWIINGHSVPEPPFYLSIITSPQQGGVSTNITDMLITSNLMWRKPMTDFVFLRLSSCPAAYCMLEYFTENLPGVYEGCYFGRDQDGQVRRNGLDNVRQDRSGFTHTDVFGRPIVHHGRMWSATPQRPTVLGDCGSPMCVIDNAGSFILGFHAMGGNGQVFALELSRSHAREAVAKLAPIQMSLGKVPIDAPSAPRDIGPLHRKSPVLFTEHGVGEVMGTFTDFRAAPKSKVEPTTMASVLQANYGYEQKWCPPPMDYRPLHTALQDMVQPVTLIDTARLEKCANVFAQHIIDALGAELQHIHPVPEDIAVNGCPGVTYCDKLNRQTSAGAPYKRSKQFFFTHVESPPGQDNVEFCSEIRERKETARAAYLRGERFHAQFCAHLKDQALTHEKAAKGKTRIFSSLEVAVSLLTRELLISIPMSVQNNRYVWCSGPGTVAQSLEWEELRNYLTKFGPDRIVAGDYAAFDKKMPPCVVLEAFRVIMCVCEAAGYSQDELRVVWGLANDFAFPTTDFAGDLIMFYGTNPSGHPLTVIINGVAGVLYMLYCFDALRPASIALHLFFFLVALMTYGDDMAMGVCKSIPWFNHTAIQHVLGEVGITFTMADKTSASREYIHIDECTFLKRAWRWDHHVGAYLAPLEEDSIIKSLMISTASRTITAKARDVAAIGSAVREYFFYGKEVFEEKVDFLKTVVALCGLTPYVEESTFPTWDALYLQFWENSRHVRLSRLS